MLDGIADGTNPVDKLTLESARVKLDATLAGITAPKSIEITPPAKMNAGDGLDLAEIDYKVIGKGGTVPSQQVSWDLEGGNNSYDTKIVHDSWYGTYTLNIGSDETSRTITLRATSVEDPMYPRPWISPSVSRAM